MMRTAVHRPTKAGVPITGRDAEDPVLRAIQADTFDDRVSEDIYDIEDERAAVDIIVHRMNHGAD